LTDCRAAGAAGTPPEIAAGGQKFLPQTPFLFARLLFGGVYPAY